MLMKRLHLVELEDLPWVPRAIRNGATDVLDWLFGRLRMYASVADRLRAMLDATGQRDIVDLCSGGAGGAVAMAGYLRERGDTGAHVVLTDRYPNEAAIARVEELGDPRVRYDRSAVDARAVPRELKGVRTMYTALHHFRPRDVVRLLEGAVADRAPVAFFDIAAQPALRRLPVALVPLVAIPNFILTFIAALLVAPFVRPLRASRLGLTYLVPLVPFLYAWDGTVSLLRAYAPDELAALTREVPGGERYTWDVGRAGSGLRAVVYVTGRPV
jgi:hypothetical protein